MLSLSFVALSLAALAIASPTKRDGLTVALSPSSNNVNSINDLRISAAVTNNGAEDLKVLNYGSILDNTLPTRSFTVSKDGAATNFTGIKINLDTRKLTDNSYTVIPAGKTVTVEHDVSALFDFQSAGAGVFSFEPVMNFHVDNGNSKTARLSTVNSTPVSVTVNDVSSKRELLKKSNKAVTKRSIGKRAQVACDDSSLSGFIANSYSTGQSLAAAAADYASSGGSLLDDYFGGNADSVVEVLNNVANEDDNSRTLNCDDALNACSDGVIAYTVIATTDIYFCDIFYDEQADPSALCSGTTVNDRDISGGTTLHELTHATSGTDDIGYGCPQDQQLSSSQALQNADNFNCFATAVYAATQC